MKKRRYETKPVEIDFSLELAPTSDSIALVQPIQILRDGVHVTAAFGGPGMLTPVVSDDARRVAFWLSGSDEQLPGRHRILCRVETTQGRIIEGKDLHGLLLPLDIIW